MADVLVPLPSRSSTDKNRHTAHISEVEKETACKLLLHALGSLDSTDQWMGLVAVAQEEIRAAMKILNMKEPD